MALITIFPVVLILFTLSFIFTQNPKPVRGIYRLPGKWTPLKRHIFALILWLRDKNNQNKKNRKRENAGYGIKSHVSDEDMDKAQQLNKEHPKAVDAVYFNGSNMEGYYFVAAAARRHNNLVQTILFIRIPELGLLELPALPDTEHYTKKEMAYSSAGMEIHVIKPMKQWQIKFDGCLRLVHNRGHSEHVTVSFNLTWDSYTRYFNFDTDMNKSATCDAMSLEPWNREFFKRLKNLHQTHYEQFGTIQGDINIASLHRIKLNVKGVRDHSYGNIREWKQIHRYSIQYLHLEDGTSIAIGLICMPETLSRLPMGYVMHPDGSMDTVSKINFEFWNQGDDGKPPDKTEFTFQAGSIEYKLMCHVVESPIFYMDLNWQSRIHERMCFFEVNGIKGSGISEWAYRNNPGRPE